MSSRAALLERFRLSSETSDCPHHGRARELFCASCSVAACVFCMSAHPCHNVLPLVEAAAAARFSLRAAPASGVDASFTAVTAICRDRLAAACAAQDALAGKMESARLRVAVAREIMQEAVDALCKSADEGIADATARHRVTLESMAVRAEALMAVRAVAALEVASSAEHQPFSCPYRCAGSR